MLERFFFLLILQRVPVTAVLSTAIVTRRLGGCKLSFR